MQMTRRSLFLVAGAGLIVACTGQAQAQSRVVRVHRSPTCGCCGAWVDHLRGAGFEVNVEQIPDVTSVARRLGVPDPLRSCHTGEVGGYFVEGHVPAADINRLLAERPTAAGLAVPGMPMGSPGMEMGDHREPYQTLLVQRDGSTTVFAQH